MPEDQGREHSIDRDRNRKGAERGSNHAPYDRAFTQAGLPSLCQQGRIGRVVADAS
jgi:hypothetical protein